MKLDLNTDRFDKRPMPAAELPLRCRHGVASGSGCTLCGEVVSTLSGERPWWAGLWRFWHRWWT